jgi:hypothetical protein
MTAETKVDVKLLGPTEEQLQKMTHMTGINYADLDLETAAVVAGGALMARLLDAKLQFLEPNQGTFFGPWERESTAKIAQRRLGPIARARKWVAPGKTVNGRSNPAHAADIVQVNKDNIKETLGLTVKEYEQATKTPFVPGYFLRVTRVY